MKFRKIKNQILYLMAIGASILLLFFMVTCTWIGYEVKVKCEAATAEYGAECVSALVMLLRDENQGFRARNDAIWALGQLGDSRALLALQNHYTGKISEREPIDQMISQYELKKAINLTSGGLNLSAVVWRSLMGVQTK